MTPRILVFASGSKDGGGSGLRWLWHATQVGILRAKIVGVVSNHEHGGVRRIADEFGLPFVHLPSHEPTADEYRAICHQFRSELNVFSGWLKFVVGIDGLNIHPGILPYTAGFHGSGVHAEAIRLYQQGEIKHTAVTMHLILEKKNEVPDKSRYDAGPILFQFPVAIEADDDAESLGGRVNRIEHGWQSYITNLVVQNEIGYANGEVFAPNWYRFSVLMP